MKRNPVFRHLFINIGSEPYKLFISGIGDFSEICCVYLSMPAEYPKEPINNGGIEIKSKSFRNI